MKNCFCLTFVFMLSVLAATSHADVSLVLDPDGTEGTGVMTLDVDDPTLPDPDPTTLGPTTSLTVFDTLDINGNSVVNLDGGNLGGGTFLAGNSALNVISGEANGVVLFENSSFSISGGRVRSLEAGGTGQVNVSGGTTTFAAGTSGSAITVTGGEINGEVSVSDGGSFLINGGDFNRTAFNGSSLMIGAGGEGTIAGGSVAPDVLVDVFGVDAQLNLVGSDFSLVIPDPDLAGTGLETLVPVSGLLTEADLPFDQSISLTGTLQDGSSITLQPTLGGGGTINLVSVPEPNGLVLLGAASLIGTIRRRRK